MNETRIVPHCNWLLNAFLWVCLCLPVTGFAHTDDAANDDQQRELSADESAVVASLESFAAAYAATDLDAIREQTLQDGRFSSFEGTFADRSWDDYAAHLAEEMPSFSETRYELTDIRPETLGDMGFATFDWQLDVIVLSDQFPGGRHPVSMQGIGTAVLVKSDGGWKLRHLHTARKTASPPADSQSTSGGH